MMHSRSNRQLLIDAVAERQALIARRECRDRRRRVNDEARCAARSSQPSQPSQPSQVEFSQYQSFGAGSDLIRRSEVEHNKMSWSHVVDNKLSCSKIQNGASNRCRGLPVSHPIPRSISRSVFRWGVWAILRSFLSSGMTAAKGSAPTYTQWQSSKSQI